MHPKSWFRFRSGSSRQLLCYHPVHHELLTVVLLPASASVMSINLKSNFAYSMMGVSASINVTNLKSSRQNTIWFEYLIVISSKFRFGVWLLCSWPVHRKLLSPANSPENVQTSTCQLKKYKPRDSIGISCESPDRLRKISVFLRNIPNRQIVS